MRNWIERLVGKKVAWVVPIGHRWGRALYAITDYDGNEEDWFLDYNTETGERYEGDDDEMDF